MDMNTLVSELGRWSAGHGPLYQRLAERLRTLVGSGVLGTDSKLPSERDLARALEVSRTTVIAAYRLLREEGLLESARGSGTRVATAGRWVGPAVPVAVTPATKLISTSAGDAIDLSGAVIPGLDGVSDEALRLSPADIRGLAGQFDYAPLGLPALRAAIATRYTQGGLPTGPGQILVTTGGQQAIDLLFTLFGRDHGTIITENPTYAGALDAASAAGATVLGLPVDGEGLRTRALSEALDRTAARLVYVTATCHNPTAAVMSTARRHDITRLAAAAGVPVVDDTTLADLLFDADSPPPLAATTEAGTVVTVGSLSKLCWAGLRVGWIRADEHLIARLARLKVVTDLGSSHLSQLLALRLLPGLAELGVVRRRQLAERYESMADLLRDQLPGWTWERPRGGPFLWARLPHGDTGEFAQFALDHGVRVLPGNRTSPDDSFTDHLRLSFVLEPAQLRTAVARLAEAWAVFQVRRGHRPVEVVV